MNKIKLLETLLAEEQHSFKGWDFSYITDRMSEQEVPWDYRESVQKHLNQSTNLLDMGTGGGEFLLSLSPPKGKTYATEAYPPNYELCKRTLPAHGIQVKQVFDDHLLPFETNFFDLIINRHEAFSIKEVKRILSDNGLFITQQVGGQNNRTLSRFLIGDDCSTTDPTFDLENTVKELIHQGFTIIEAKEFFPELKFYDIGALVYFAKIIEWEFRGFSVQSCFDKLCYLQEKLELDGFISSQEHRFFILAKK